MDFATLINVAYTRGGPLPLCQRGLERDVVKHIQWYRADNPRCSEGFLGGDHSNLTIVPDVRDTAVEDVGEVSRGQSLLEELNRKARLASLELVLHEVFHAVLVGIIAEGPPVQEFVEAGVFEVSTAAK